MNIKAKKWCDKMNIKAKKMVKQKMNIKAKKEG